MEELLTRFYQPLRKKAQRFRHRKHNNFIFIHINKTGGSSIEKALDLSFKHETALEKIQKIGRSQWNKKFTFTVVRNPWDKVVSHYHYRVQTNQTNLGVEPIEFREWVKLSYRDKDPFYYDMPKMFMPQSDWISDNDGTILVNFVCRFENLQNDFEKVCKSLKRKAELPHLKSSKRKKHYKDYYDEETIEIVRSSFSKDIKNFGYRF
ncbi:sulfotransferase family 2 domain-containing protein [Synechococcus sp. PCC 7336]|uniref:sulfotransferase family 2 domain-containing protein n=1 Tax=Synechococcus sp. PCC 7336 TaxID=195250 RepID=UPI00034C79B9|nr:sulfotransferase family 2 domain-containing protein [Synechococcus sp. PCC 7336]